MAACTFFGHRNCYGLDKERLRQVIIELIGQGVNTFYVGNQGQFDTAVYFALRDLKEQYPHMHYAVVLAYLPGKSIGCVEPEDTIYPEGLENVHPRYAIDRRNRWMLLRSEFVVCYIRHGWGGAARYVDQARRKGKVIVAL